MGSIYDMNEASILVNVSRDRLKYALTKKGGLGLPEARVGGRPVFNDEDISRLKAYFKGRQKWARKVSKA